MPKDQGKKKGRGTNDATLKIDAAIPAKPAALSDTDLEKVAGGASFDPRITNGALSAFRTPNTFITPNK